MKNLKMDLNKLRVESFVTEAKDLKGKMGGGTEGSCGLYICEPSNPCPTNYPTVLEETFR